MIQDFQSASREVLEFLHKRFGFDLWMVTRTEAPCVAADVSKLPACASYPTTQAMAVRRHDDGLLASVKEADAEMYRVKKARKAGRSV